MGPPVRRSEIGRTKTMTPDDACDTEDAVRRFAGQVGAARPERVLARLDGLDGMSRLCAVEATIAALWPPTTAKELVWLTRTDHRAGDVLHLQAFADDGAVLAQASFRLRPAA